MPEFVRVNTEEHVATVVIDRPDVHNAFNEVVIGELTAAFRAVGEDGDVHVAILASTGPSFSAGADVNWMRKMVDYSFDENVADATEMAGMLRAIRECPKPVIARIQGPAIGGGVGLTAACDLAVAVRTAFFALTEVKLGILPAVISPFVMEKMGAGAMRRYALTAERFDADEARRLGLVSEVEDDQAGMDAKIAFFVKLMKKNGPEALDRCKAILRTVQPIDWDDATRATAEAIAERRASSEGQDGLRAFLEKRKPGWVASP